MKTFNDFADQVRAAALEPVDHGNYHWQIKGGRFTVNYYPTTGTIYVNGTATKRQGGIAKAIQHARKLPKVCRKRAERPSQNERRRVRKELLRNHPRCKWCGCKLNMQTATIEHIIPLARGGSNGMDNLTLACAKCNEARGHDMPELAGKGGA